jgi:YidC/Oxa1 family membrane protein insertase
MFRTFVEQPVFNLLEVIYGLVPGHDLGLAIILFTIVIRLALWPLVRKQLHHARAIKKLQPELKKIKAAAKGDRQKQARLQMELYKEHEIKPFATIGTLIIQIPIFIALYQAVLKLINDPNTLQTFSYSWVKDLPWVKEIAADASRFSPEFLGVFDLTKYGLDRDGGLYLGAIFLALVATAVQFMHSRLMIRDQQDARKLSDILKESAAGKDVDQAEVTAAVSRAMMYFLPFVTFIFAINVPSALSLYLLTSSGMGFLQQWMVLRQDQEEMTQVADAKTSEATTKTTKSKKKAKKPSTAKKKRRK